MSDQPDRETIQKLFIRVCRDSSFSLEHTRAAHLVGSILGKSAIEVWIAFSDLDTMRRISTGEHPCLVLPRYAEPSSVTR